MQQLNINRCSLDDGVNAVRARKEGMLLVVQNTAYILRLVFILATGTKLHVIIGRVDGKLLGL